MLLILILHEMLHGDTRKLTSNLWGYSNLHAAKYYFNHPRFLSSCHFATPCYPVSHKYTIQASCPVCHKYACTWHFFLGISFALLWHSFQQMPPNRLPWKLCGTSCFSLLFLKISYNWLHLTYVTMPIVQVRCATTKPHISAGNAELLD